MVRKIIFAFLCLCLAACGDSATSIPAATSAPTTAPTVANTVAVFSPTVAPATIASTLPATATSAPPTPTVAPTATVQPTAVPPTVSPTASVAALTPAAVVAAWKKAGLGTNEVVPIEQVDGGPGPRPMLELDGIHFKIPGPNVGGRVLHFASEADLQVVKRYYDQLGQASAMLYSYTATNGLLLLQVVGDCPKAIELKYQNIFTALK